MEAFGEIAACPEIANQLIEKAPKAKTSKIRSLTKERQAIRRQLKDLETEVKALTEKILRYAGTVVGDEIDQQVKGLTEQKTSLTKEEVRLNREIDTLKSDILAPEKLQQALTKFSEAVKCLPEDEQRELYKLLFKSVIVNEGGKAKDPLNENARRTREGRRHLSVEVRLRTEAIQILFGGESDSARKKGFTIPLEIAHCRKKPMENCAILSPVHKECGYKTPALRKRQKKKEHEIHRAIRWKKEMEELGIGQNELARKKGLSYPAMAQAMRWLKLSPEAQSQLKSITDGALMRKLGRRSIFPLIELPAAEQVLTIKEMIRSAC